MAKRGRKFVFTPTHLARISSLVGMVFVLTIFFSVNTHLRFLIAGIDFLFGLAGLYVLGIYLFIYCAFHLVFGLKRHVPKRLFVSVILIFFGLLLLFPDIGFAGMENARNPDLFLDAWKASYQTIGMGFLSDLRLGGGIIGYSISGALVQSGNRFWPIFISSVLLFVACIIAAWPYIIAGIRKMRAKAAIAKAEKAQRKQDELADSVSPFGIAMPSENINPEPKEEEYVPPVPEYKPPEDSFTPTLMPEFAPASKTLMPSRRSLRVKQEAPKQEPLPQTQLVAPTPDKPFITSSSLRTNGFKKAYFGPVDVEKEKEVVIPVEENQPKRVFAHIGEEELKPEDIPVFEVPAPDLPPLQKEEPKPAPVEVIPAAESLPVEEPSFTMSVAPAPIITPAPEPEPVVASEPVVEPEPIPVPPVVPAAPAPMPAPMPTPAPAPVAEPEPKKDDLGIEEAEELPPYELPPLTLLQGMENAQNLEEMEADCANKEMIINKVFADLKAGARVIGHIIGPSVTQFSIQPDDNVSVSTLGRYQKDLEMRLGGLPTRFAERVSGMTYCALEVANSVCRTISFRELFMGLPPLNEKNSMLVPFGEDITGKVRYADLTELPHMLIAGTTGSGKSVFVHGLLFSLLMRNRPEELKLVLVDPKRVEMNKYRDLPHLLCPIIKEPSEAKVCLKKLCDEMDRRFKVFEKANVQSIRDYNEDYCEYAHKKKMPFIVVVIDEFADLVGAEKEVSDHVLRIGQKARAAGIHMIIATQRPDVKIITGTIKSNLPTRIALTVASTIDSQTILGVKGAEELNGKGDMLIDCVQVAKKEFVRAQGAFVTSRDMRVIGDFIREQMGPKYDPDFLDLTEKEEEIPGSVAATGAGFEEGPSESTLGAIKAAGDEEKYQMIKAEVMKREFTSISQIQRDYSVGFPRAGKIYSRLLKEGIISLDSPNSSKGAKVVVHASEPSNEGIPGASTENTTTEYSGDYE